jgi:hypothetical protein
MGMAVRCWAWVRRPSVGFSLTSRSVGRQGEKRIIVPANMVVIGVRSQQGSSRRCDSGAYAIEAARTRIPRHAAALGRNGISYVRALAPLTSRSKAAGSRHRDTLVAL